MLNINIQDALKVKNVSYEAYQDIYELLNIVHIQSKKASKETHYHKLDKWSETIYNFIHSTLDKYGFKNGKPDYNEKIPDIKFWWCIYSLMSNIIYSPNIESEVVLHHSSAYERNKALKKDLVDLLYHINKK